MKTMSSARWLLIATVLFGFSPLHAEWIENGVPLTRQWGNDGFEVIASDGSSGAIVAFRACYLGVAHIVAQRVDSLGANLWGEDGIVVCSGTQDSRDLYIISDGAGGAIVAWVDRRGGDYDVYAQKVNAEGVVQWTASSIVVCNTVEDEYSPEIIGDGTGGAIIVWKDIDADDYMSADIHAQRVDAAGSVQWSDNGILIWTGAGLMQPFQVVSDGEHGAIITWSAIDDDFLMMGDVYAQRVSHSGVIQWETGGIPVCPASSGYQSSPCITADGDGGAIIAWSDYRGADGDIYAQRLNSLGAALWNTDGVVVCAAADNQGSAKIETDIAGGAILAWFDMRGMNSGIYAQRISASGAARWTSDGVPLCTAEGDKVRLLIVSDGSGGVIAAWGDRRSGNYDVYAQRVDSLGSTLWLSDGAPVCTAEWDQEDIGMCPAGANGAIVKWRDIRGGEYNIYGQRIIGSGDVQWAVDGICVSRAAGEQYNAQILAHGAGAIVVWNDSRNGKDDIYAQRIDPTGTVLWTEHGAPLCMAIEDQESPQIAPDDAGGAIVAWRDYRNDDADIYAQRVDSWGSVRWASDGIAVCSRDQAQTGPQLAADGAGGAIIVWRDYRSGNFDIYAQRVTSEGIAIWTENGVPVCTASNSQVVAGIVPDGAGGAIVVWHDYRNGDSDIYAQRMSSSGIPGWAPNGVEVCTATASQEGIQIIADGNGGVIITWHDYRGGDSDIYAQRLNSMGAEQWGTNGMAVCTATGIQWYPSITSDNNGGAIIVWDDDRDEDGGDIYAQSIDSSGYIQWAYNGVVVCAVVGRQSSPQITFDGSGGAVIAWNDDRLGEYVNNIYAQRIDASGAAQWNTNGEPICTEGGGCPIIVAPDGCGGAVIAWQDGRCGYWIYAQRTISVTGVEDETPAFRNSLAQNYPNPFNPSTRIVFELEKSQLVSLKIFDISGRLVRILVDGVRPAGRYEEIWDGRNAEGKAACSGVYFYRIATDDFRQTWKMILLR